MNLKSVEDFYRTVLGINARNLEFIYPSNPRKYFPVADDKLMCKELLGRNGVPVPKTYYVVTHMAEITPLWNSITLLDEFAIKPARGKAGGGILVLKKGGTGWVDGSGVAHGASELRKHMADIIFGVYSFGNRDRAMIEYRVHQHAFFDRIFPQGVADIRVLMYNHVPRMTMARIPTRRSRGKANLHQGALGIGIDLETGVMKDGYDYHGYPSRHPDTNVEFKGATLPFWAEILSLSIRTSQSVPLRYLGVDIVIDQQEGPLVMEINARPGLEIQNVNRRGLRDILGKE